MTIDRRLFNLLTIYYRSERLRRKCPIKGCGIIDAFETNRSGAEAINWAEECPFKLRRAHGSITLVAIGGRGGLRCVGCSVRGFCGQCRITSSWQPPLRPLSLSHLDSD